MSAFEVLRRCLGDTSRFLEFRERIEMLFEEQVRTWTANAGAWLVIPIDRTPAGFYLLSADNEGQRRGREMLTGFLGPATATFESTPLAPEVQQIDRDLLAAGFLHLSHVLRTDASHGRLLERLEDAVATVKGKDARSRPTQPSHLHLLRDFRLALRQHDGRQAEQALADLRLTGRLSAENIRFLTIEMLGSLGRWSELRDLTYLSELLRARRPRAINEFLLEMIWRTEISDLDTAGMSPDAIYAEADLGPRYGAVLSSVDVPASEAGRAVGVVVAIALEDDDRLGRLLLAARDDVERERLKRIADRRHHASAETPSGGIRELFEQGQYGAVVRAFIDTPEPAVADLAVQAVLECSDGTHAADILATIEGFVGRRLLTLSRRLRRDLDDMAELADSTCTGWVPWCGRVGKDEPWPEAERVLRALHEQWGDLSDLSAAQLQAAADALLEAWDGVNQNQVVAALDLLCHAAAKSTAMIHAAHFCDAVLLLLAAQQNLSAPVRDAYLELFDQILESGPSPARYKTTLDHAVELWQQISAPTTVDWGIGLVDFLLLRPASELGARINAINVILSKARDFGQRLNLRQRTEIEILAGEAGLPTRQTPTATTGIDIVWHKLDGRLIGVYSLLPRAAESLTRRLTSLCSPRAVEGNGDMVSTSALKSLATRADHMIVDTWHAAHAATQAIDAVRPRDQQIFPRGRGVSAYLQALEQALVSADT